MKFVARKNHNIFFGLVALGIFLAFLAFTIGGENGLVRLYRLSKVKNGLLAANRELLYQNLALRQQQKSLYQMQTLEYRARASLGLVYADEVVYVVPSGN